MKLSLKRKLTPFMTLPRGYGIAYVDLRNNDAVCYPVPFNFVVGWYVKLERRLKRGPNAIRHPCPNCKVLLASMEWACEKLATLMKIDPTHYNRATHHELWQALSPNNPLLRHIWRYYRGEYKRPKDPCKRK